MKKLFSPTDESFGHTDGHGFYHADGVFFEHELNEYNEFAMRMVYFILPQMAQMNTDFLYKNIKNTVYIFRAYSLLKIHINP